MGLFDRFKQRQTQPDGEADEELNELNEQGKKIDAYLRERGLTYELAKNEIPFAVVWPTQPEEAISLKELGKQLVDWQARTRGVTRVLEVERLLEGKRPEVPGFLLMIPYSPHDPNSWVENVALVVMNDCADKEKVASSLNRLALAHGAANATSWEQYSYMNR